MDHPPSHRSESKSCDPFWKRLFSGEEFGWVFRMRAGDAGEFFAAQDTSGRLLAERRRWLEESPGLYAAVTPSGEPLVRALWEMAAGWGHVDEPQDGERDLARLGRELEPDVLMMDLETMTMVAACVCMPSSWSLRHTIGKPVHAIHDLVPQLNPQIGEQIERFLRQLQPGKAFRRENWGFTRSGELNDHPDLKRPRLDEIATLDEVFLRIEHQVFTAIDGGVLLGIRIESCPLADLAADPEVWRSVAEKIRTMPDDVADYKGMLAARDAILREMERFRALSA